MDKTIRVEFAFNFDKELTPVEYRLKYGITKVEECECASLEYACGFLDEDNQLDLFVE